MPHPLSRILCRPQTDQQFTVDGETYKLGGKIGDGAVGLVRKASRIRDNRVFAIKFLAPDPKYIEESAFDDVATRFTREGERGRKLDCPFLLKIHDTSKTQMAKLAILRKSILTMELVGGKTLEVAMSENLQPMKSQSF